MRRVLVVDDEVDIAETLQQLLELLGYDVILAFDGEEGLRKVRETHPDLIVTDVMMPVLSGDQMLEALSQEPRDRTIPVVVMSAGDGRAVADRFGARFIAKPFEFARLRHLLEEVLDGAR